MISKSEAGTTLDSINRYVRVANKIFTENVPNHTGYNTEINILARMLIIEV